MSPLMICRKGDLAFSFPENDLAEGSPTQKQANRPLPSSVKDPPGTRAAVRRSENDTLSLQMIQMVPI